MKLQALKKRCIIERVAQESITVGGIILQQADQDPNPRARIVSTGAEVTDVKEGDIVIVNWQFVVQLTREDPKYYITEEGNILAVEE